MLFRKERREKLMRDLRFRSEFLARGPERAVVRKQATDPGERDHPAHRPRRAIGKGRPALSR